MGLPVLSGVLWWNVRGGGGGGGGATMCACVPVMQTKVVVVDTHSLVSV